MSTTAGFYKADGNTLLYAPNFVHGPGFDLLRDTHTTDIVDGWQWFDSASEAYAAAGLPSIPDPDAALDALTVAVIRAV